MVLQITPHLPCYLVLSKPQHLVPWLALGCQAVYPPSRHTLILFHV